MSAFRAQAPRRFTHSPSLHASSFLLPPDAAALPEELFHCDFADGLDSNEQDGLSRLMAEVQAFPAARGNSAEELFAFRDLLLEAAQRVSARWQDLVRLRSLALTDDLTGLYNRRGFLFMASQHIKLAGRMNQSLLLFFMDVDNFKAINDSLGHLRGDAFLICCSHVLKQTFRETDIVSRLGGDEFAVLALEGADNTSAAISHRLEASLDALNRNVSSPEKISFSTGMVRFDPHNPVSIGELLSLADRRMYEEKTARHRAAASA